MVGREAIGMPRAQVAEEMHTEEVKQPLHLLVSDLARPTSVSCPLPHGAVGQP